MFKIKVKPVYMARAISILLIIYIFMLPGAAADTPNIDDPSLLIEFHMNDSTTTAIDSGPYGNDGSYNSGSLPNPVNAMYPLNGSGQSFDGSGDYANYNNNLIGTGDDFTVTFWFTPDDQNNGDYLYTLRDDIIHFMYRSGTDIVFYDGGATRTLTAETIGDSYCIGLSFDDGTFNWTGYVNGTNTINIIGGNPAAGDKTGNKIGDKAATGSDIAGDFDEFRLWNRTLSSGEHNNLCKYNDLEAPGGGPPGDPTVPAFNIESPANNSGTAAANITIRLNASGNFTPDNFSIVINGAWSHNITGALGLTYFHNTTWSEGVNIINISAINSTLNLYDFVYININRSQVYNNTPNPGNYTANRSVIFSYYCNGSNSTVLRSWIVLNGTHYANTSSSTINTLTTRIVNLPTFGVSYNYYSKCEYQAAGLGSWDPYNESGGNNTLYWIVEAQLYTPTDGYFFGQNTTTPLVLNVSQGSPSAIYFIVNGNEIYLNNTNCSGVYCNLSNYTMTQGLNNWTAIVTVAGVNTTIAKTWEFRTLLDPRDCSTSGPTASEFIALRFFVYDEENLLTEVVGATVGASMSILYNGVSFDMAFSNNSVYPYLDICLDNEFRGREMDADLTYHNGAPWPARHWYIRNYNITNSTANASLYLLNTTWAEQALFNVYDAAGNSVEAYIIRLKRFDYDSSDWVVMTMAITDDIGGSAIYLRPSDTYLVFEVADTTGTVLKEFPARIITQTDNTLRLDPGTAGYWFLTKDGISSNCSFNNATAVLSCVVADSTGLMTRGTLTVLRGGVFNWSSYCTDNDTGVSLDLSCTLTNDREYWYIVTVGFSSEKQVAASGLVGSRNTTGGPGGAGWGSQGVFIGGLLGLSMGLIGVYQPPLAIILYLVGTVLAIWVDLYTPASSSTLGYLITMGGFIIWRLRSK